MLPWGLTSLLDSGKNKASSAAGPARPAGPAAAAALVLQASKTYPSPHRNTMLLKDGTTSKNMLPWGLTSLLDSDKNKASSAAGPAAAAAGGGGGGRGGGDAAGAGAAGLPDEKTPWRQNVAQKLPNVSSVSSETVENCVKHGLRPSCCPAPAVSCCRSSSSSGISTSSTSSSSSSSRRRRRRRRRHRRRRPTRVKCLIPWRAPPCVCRGRRI